MSDERMQVLEMVADGKLTVEQGDRLLQALEPPQPEERRSQTVRSHTHSTARRGIGPQLRKLREARMLGVDANYVREMERAGFEDLSLQDLAQLRVHGIDSEFVQEMRSLVGDVGPSDLIDLRIHGLTGEFIREMQELGLGELSLEELVHMHEGGIDAETAAVAGKVDIEPRPER